MSVLIKGMEMPKSCEDCPMAFSVNFGIWGNHGVCLCGRGGDFNDVCEAIEEAPTIIEAEEDCGKTCKECDCDMCSIPHTGTCRRAEEGE